MKITIFSTRLHHLLPVFAAVWIGIQPAAAQTTPEQTGRTDIEAPSEAAVETRLPETGDPFVDELNSIEQGQTPLFDSFEWDRRRWRLERRREALLDTQFKINPRLYYFHRDQYDGSVSEALAIGGSAGLRTGYFLDRIAIGVTEYTSQALHAPDDRDGTSLLAPGQEGYSALGELYADIRLVDGWNLYVGRKEFDTPFINDNDSRMTPNTFEAIAIQGQSELGEDASIKGGIGYFYGIKERNSDTFVSMSEDAGAEVERGVAAAGAVYEKGNFTFGFVDYYSPDIINIGYLESTLAIPFGDNWEPRLAAQFIDQRSVGDNLLDGEEFSGQQVGVKVDVPVGHALFTAGYTHITSGTDMRNPWSGYPGYTAVQVGDFNRAGEDAFLLRAAYELPWVDGLSAYALWVHGSDPEGADEFSRDEYDLNLQWKPTKGALKGLSVRLRYAVVDQHGGDSDYLNDFRVITSYTLNF